MAIKAKDFNNVGGFDEDFFAHMEEIDLCWRAKNKGYRIEYTGASTVYHVGGASLNVLDPKKTYFNFRNSLYTLVKNTHHKLFGIVLLRLVLDGFAGLRFLFQGKVYHLMAILKAHGRFYLELPRLLILRKKQEIKKHEQRLPSIVWSHFVRQIEDFNKLFKY
jgi:GT2 family glycosyltransferase